MRKDARKSPEYVNQNQKSVGIVSKNGNAVLMSADEYAACADTAYLFRSPKNARRLLDSYERACAGQTKTHDLDRSE